MKKFKTIHSYALTYVQHHYRYTDSAHTETVVREDLSLVEVGIIHHMVNKDWNLENLIIFRGGRSVNPDTIITNELKGYIKTLYDAKFKVISKYNYGTVDVVDIVMGFHEHNHFQKINNGRHYTYADIVEKYL